MSTSKKEYFAEAASRPDVKNPGNIDNIIFNSYADYAAFAIKEYEEGRSKPKPKPQQSMSRKVKEKFYYIGR